MAESLLAHLYSRIKGSQEDVATMSLQYLLSQSSAMKQAFTDLVASSLNIDIWEELQYSCQSVGENKERPDMVGKNRTGTEVVLCEMKFYAGLTHNQPLGYLDRIATNKGKGLVFICPKVRESSLWNKLLTLCKDREVEEVKPYSVLVDGIPMDFVPLDKSKGDGNIEILMWNKRKSIKSIKFIHNKVQSILYVVDMELGSEEEVQADMENPKDLNLSVIFEPILRL